MCIAAIYRPQYAVIYERYKPRHIARYTCMHVPCNMHPRLLRGATNPKSALARSAFMLHIANAPNRYDPYSHERLTTHTAIKG